MFLGPAGYAIRTPHERTHHGWHEVSRVDWADGYVFVYLAADRVRRETIGLILPPRAFHDSREAEAVCEQIWAWQEGAAGKTPR